MTRSLRIAVADDQAPVRDFLCDALRQAGHEVVCVAATGAELAERCAAVRPDLIITDVRMPDMDGIEAARRVARDHPVPVIILSGYHDADLVERAVSTGVLAYLLKPIRPTDLEVAIAVALRRFEQLQGLSREAADLRRRLEERKLIERAKGIVTRRLGLDEAEAYRRLQKLATAHNRKLAELAQSILDADGVFQELERG
jgi:response regulator NasT